MEPTASVEEPMKSGNQDFDQNVSTEPFCELVKGSKPKHNIEEFLRHETDTPYDKGITNEVNETLKPNNVVNKESVVDPEPISNNSSTKDVKSDGSHKESEHSDNNNSEVCAMSRPDKSFQESESEHLTANNKQSSISSENMNSDLPQSDRKESLETDKLADINISKTGDVTSSVTENDSPQDNSESVVMKMEEDEWVDILGSGHLLKKVLKSGEPDTRPNKSDICVLSLIGRLEDGTVVENRENFKIHLNDNEVIQGIDFALALMEKGEEAEVKVGPRFAYGSLGRKPDVPSGATLFYTVKLLDVQEDPPINTLPSDERIKLGLQKKERGNWWYSRDEHSIAINCYRRALEFLDDTDIPEPNDEQEVHRLVEERLKTYNNLTASQMKIHAYDAALMSVNYVLTSQPNNIKALFRKSKILKEKGDIPEAIKVVRLALSFDKDSPSLQQELSSLLAAQRKHNTEQRELYKKMLGTSTNPDKDEKNSKSSYSSIKWTSIFAFAVVVVAGTVAFKYKM